MLNHLSDCKEVLPNIRNEVRVDATDFETMLVSNRQLQRCDSPDLNLLGLYDPELKVRFVIDEHELFHHAESVNGPHF